MPIKRDSGRYSPETALNLALGQDGSTIFNTVTERKAEDYNCNFWFAIQMITDCSFAQLDDDTADGDSHSSSTVYKAGTIIFGTFKTIELSLTGEVCIAYKGNKQTFNS